MKKFIGTLLLIVIAGFGIYATTGLKNNNVKKEIPPVPVQISAHNITITKDIQEEKIPGIPQRIRIPAININTNVESVGVTGPNRKMEVPKNASNGGWYNLGAKPGEKGSAVIAGHYDKKDSSPAIFWNLNKLTLGDKIIIADSQGIERTFAVIKTVKYPYNEFPLQQVFGDSSEPLLNLITCQGSWNTGTRNYSHRLVVYAKYVKG